MRRTAESLQREAENRIARPFDLILRLEGSTADWFYGRFRLAARAFAVADEAMRARGRSNQPYGRRCIGYRVIDSRTGQPVERPSDPQPVAA